MAFKKMRSLNMSYNRQGKIYFICHNYADMPDTVRAKIDTLCAKVAPEEHRAALMRALTTDEPLERIARIS